MAHDTAFLLLSFGGPESRDDVLPFLENVTRGRNVPRERLEVVAEHYYQFDGVSPINQQCRDLLAKLEPAMRQRGIDIPLYWGNRNWHPMLEDTMAQMADDGINQVYAFATSAYSSYSGCRQYREDIARAQSHVGDRAPQVTKLRQFYDHPGFISPIATKTNAAVQKMREKTGEDARIVFTAHSIPSVMGETSRYSEQLAIASQLVIDRIDRPFAWDLVFQSRSGPPSQPWLEPDIVDHIEKLHTEGVKGVVVVPIGFVSDHLEVLFDLDIEAANKAESLDMEFIRVPSVGTADEFVTGICGLLEEQLFGKPEVHLAPPIAGFVACSPQCCPSPAMLAGKGS